MKLIPEAKVWHKLWSVRLSILAAVFGAIELTLPLFTGVVTPRLFATLSMLVAIAAAASRVVKQETLIRD